MPCHPTAPSYHPPFRNHWPLYYHTPPRKNPPLSYNSSPHNHPTLGYHLPPSKCPPPIAFGHSVAPAKLQTHVRPAGGRKGEKESLCVDCPISSRDLNPRRKEGSSATHRCHRTRVIPSLPTTFSNDVNKLELLRPPQNRQPATLLASTTPVNTGHFVTSGRPITPLHPCTI